MGIFLFLSPPVCCGQLLKEAVADKSKYGEVIQPFFEKEMAGRPHFSITAKTSRALERHGSLQGSLSPWECKLGKTTGNGHRAF